MYNYSKNNLFYVQVIFKHLLLYATSEQIYTICGNKKASTTNKFLTL